LKIKDVKVAAAEIPTRIGESRGNPACFRLSVGMPCGGLTSGQIASRLTVSGNGRDRAGR
jgi:hypothetical protein